MATKEGEDDTNKVKKNSALGVGVGLENTTRWNPTKEQIALLEELYENGMRTPTAETIQAVTAKLKVYGHIEGKNVFYWFQNHKARQRQKEKQEASLAYFNRFLHTTAAPPYHPLFPHPPQYPCSNVICNPYYMPSIPSEASLFCPQSHPMVAPPQVPGVKRRPRVEKLDLPTRACWCNGGGGFEQMRHGYSRGGVRRSVDRNDELTNKGFMTNDSDDPETLPLFPLTPTGLLKSNDESVTTWAGNCDRISTAVIGSSGIVDGQRNNKASYYDFFSNGQGGCDSLI